jgi:glycosyltransferase involved in cell wall biosynthesis
MNNKRLKVLIIGQPFNKSSGGGITLSNLFEGWGKEQLAVASTGHMLSNATFDICSNYYCLGKKEHKAFFPLNFLQKKYSSGKYKLIDKQEINDITKSAFKIFLGKIRKTFVKWLFGFLHFTGLFHLLYKYTISGDFLAWVENFDPDIIYSQLSSRDMILFVDKLVKQIKKPLAIHIMDDWPSSISKPGLFYHYWKQKTDREFRNLINKANVLLSISEGMQAEYFKRYGKDFLPFHNPIDLTKWIPLSKDNYEIGENFKTIYTGRIGTANSKSIIDVCMAVNQLNNGEEKYSLHIYTPDYNTVKAQKLKTHNGVYINKPISYNEMPAMLNAADLLILPLDFDKKGIRFAKFSMPTKASEYMISATPIIVYAPEQTALVQHAKKYRWAFTVTTNNISVLKEGIQTIQKNAEIRKNLGKTAFDFALKHYDAFMIRKLFQEKMVEVID